MRNASDAIRTVSRHTLAYMLFSISELFRLYDEFDPLDLLIVHAILNPPRPAARRRQRAGVICVPLKDAVSTKKAR